MRVRLIIIGAIVAIFFSCKKNDNSTVGYNQSFTYSAGGTDYTADSSAAYLSRIFSRPAILAWNKGNIAGNFKIGFSVTSFEIGTYAFTPTVPGSNAPPPTTLINKLYYFDDNGNELRVIDGRVNIVSNADYRLAGDFTANLVDVQGLPLNISGKFTDVPIKP